MLGLLACYEPELARCFSWAFNRSFVLARIHETLAVEKPLAMPLVAAMQDRDISCKGASMGRFVSAVLWTLDTSGFT